MFVVVGLVSNANLYNQETVIAIRPIITNFVHSEALEAIIPLLPNHNKVPETVQAIPQQPTDETVGD